MTNFLTSRLGSNGQESERVDEAKQEVGCCKPSHSDHGLTQGVLDHTITHTDDKQQKERERVSASVENSYNGKENLGADIGAVAILIFCSRVR